MKNHLYYEEYSYFKKRQILKNIAIICLFSFFLSIIIYFLTKSFLSFIIFGLTFFIIMHFLIHYKQTIKDENYYDIFFDKKYHNNLSFDLKISICNMVIFYSKNKTIYSDLFFKKLYDIQSKLDTVSIYLNSNILKSDLNNDDLLIYYDFYIKSITNVDYTNYKHDIIINNEDLTVKEQHLLNRIVLLRDTLNNKKTFLSDRDFYNYYHKISKIENEVYDIINIHKINKKIFTTEYIKISNLIFEIFKR